MSIIQFNVNTPGLQDINPRTVQLVTTDNLATITAAGYLNKQGQVLQGMNLLPTDVVNCIYSFNTQTHAGTYINFNPSIDTHGTITLVVQQLNVNAFNGGSGASSSTFLRGDGTWAAAGSGSVNAGTANQMAYYASTGTAVSGLATANNSILATDGAGAPAMTTSLPTAVQVGVNSLNSGTGATNTSFWRGDGTWATVSAGITNSGMTANGVVYSTGTNAVGSATALVWDPVNFNFSAGNGASIAGGITNATAIGAGAVITGTSSGSTLMTDSGGLTLNNTAFTWVGSFSRGYQFYSEGVLLFGSMTSTLNFFTGVGVADHSKIVNIPTSGGNVAINSNTHQRYLLNPAGTLATLTLTLLDNIGAGQIDDGAIARISTTQIITSLTVNSLSGKTILAAPTTLAAGQAFAMIFDNATSSWYPTN